MKHIFIVLLMCGSLFAQINLFDDDFTFFSRKEPFTPGSAFGALGTSSIMINPANIAMITDNQVNAGWVQSEVGYGYFISWVAPNFSIANAQQSSIADDEESRDFQKRLLQFSLGLSTLDLGLSAETFSAALGINIKRISDRLYYEDGTRLLGWNATAIDVGVLIRFKYIIFELALQDLNQPKIKDTGFSYKQGYLSGIRYENAKGLKLAIQGLAGDRYHDVDFGINLAAEQSFFEQRLISRIQLTSYYAGSKAKMQNICGSIGYRFSSKGRSFFILKDLEIGYALNMLSVPRNIGTHMLTFTKYF